MHRKFRPLQNRDAADIFDRLFDPGGRKYHTGGALRNGEVVWLQARLPGTIVIEGDDVVEPYLLYSNSHDGAQAIDVRITTVRVVCRNTLSYALRGARPSEVFHRGHRDNATKLDADLQAFFKLVRRPLNMVAEELRQLAAIPVDDDTFRRFVRLVLPDPLRPRGASKDPAIAKAYATRFDNVIRARETIAQIRDEGIPTHRIPRDAPNWWGALNTVTAWADHVQAVSSNRFPHTMFGAGNWFKASALQTARAFATGRVVPLADPISRTARVA